MKSTALRPKATVSAKKAQGTLKKVLQMIEDDTYCPEVVQQIDSVIGLLKSTRMTLITGHLNTCLESHLHDQKEQTIDELLKMYKL